MNKRDNEYCSRLALLNGQFGSSFFDAPELAGGKAVGTAAAD